ncbi:hypothetical protein RND81_11G105500 [Saponaria officinalis]|uniref:Protein NUCLEAR FUSION DEFECTIVE 6, chloroplastic/mitochondrial-like n=1 Tax=Saponaria officinalis TaxID=3572 RepID=A0AAW1HKU1_SAPOF
MATMSAARSLFRSTSARSAAAKFASAAKTSSPRSSFRSPSPSNLLSSPRIFRCPAELSACLETMQPFHTMTASALMTSMLAISCRSSAWAPDGA